MPTDPMWCFENYGEAAEYIDQLEKQRDELLEELEKERKRLDWALKKQAYCGRSPDRLWVDVGTGNHKWFSVHDGNPRATIDKLMAK